MLHVKCHSVHPHSCHDRVRTAHAWHSLHQANKTVLHMHYTGWQMYSSDAQAPVPEVAQGLTPADVAPTEKGAQTHMVSC